MFEREFDRTTGLVAAAMVASTVLLGVLNYATKPTAAEQAQKERAREAHVQAVTKSCEAAKSAKQSLVAQGQIAAASAVDLEKACEPDKVAARPILYSLGAFFGGGLLLAFLLALFSSRVPRSLG